MRALVDIDDQHIRDLDARAKQQHRSRASLIREAVADYLDRCGRQAIEGSFGLRGGRKVDGLAYQDRIRSEW